MYKRQGLIDLVEMKAYIYEDDLGNVIDEEGIPADMQEKADEYRAKLLEAVAEVDEDLMMKYLDGEELTVDEIKAAIRKGTIANQDVYKRQPTRRAFTSNTGMIFSIAS